MKYLVLIAIAMYSFTAIAGDQVEIRNVGNQVVMPVTRKIDMATRRDQRLELHNTKKKIYDRHRSTKGSARPSKRK